MITRLIHCASKIFSQVACDVANHFNMERQRKMTVESVGREVQEKICSREQHPEKEAAC